jgi:hypothetical protein
MKLATTETAHIFSRHLLAVACITDTGNPAQQSPSRIVSRRGRLTASHAAILDDAASRAPAAALHRNTVRSTVSNQGIETGNRTSNRTGNRTSRTGNGTGCTTLRPSARRSASTPAAGWVDGAPCSRSHGAATPETRATAKPAATGRGRSALSDMSRERGDMSR